LPAWLFCHAGKFFEPHMIAGLLDSRNRLLHIVLLLTTATFRLDAAEKDSAASSVCFDGFVNWDFHHRQKLGAWKATAQVIQRTLDVWRLQSPGHSLMENAPPDALRQFFGALPGENDCDISLVYLASHQSPAGEWDFTQKKVILLNSIFDETKIPAHSGRIVILDTCFAAAVQRPTLWRKKFAPIFLFASTAAEKTPMVNFHTPQPVDFAHRYPAAFAWLKECLGKKWDGKISFLGFVWAETFLTVKNPAVDLHSWIDFLQECQSTARQFRENVSRKSSSEIILSVD
jgi:hypothetical protein